MYYTVDMNGRIFLTRDNTYCAIFIFSAEPITIVGEIREEITTDGIRRTPVVPAFKGEPIVCPYCMCNHEIPESDALVFPKCDYKRIQGIVKDEMGNKYTSENDGFFIKYK